MSDATHFDREAAAVREIGHTEFSSSVPRFLALAVLASFLVVPIIQQVHDVRAHVLGEPRALVPQCYDIFSALPKSVIAFVRGGPSLLDRTLTLVDSLRDDIERYEETTKSESIVVSALLPRIQEFLIGKLGMGNEQAYLGRDRWLFYRLDVDYVTGRGFLEASQIARRRHSGDRWKPAPQPDPVRAIVQFRDILAQRGIELIVVPAPPKSVVHGGKFSSAVSGGGRIQNPSYDRFIAALSEHKVHTFDPTDTLLALSVANQEVYLETDTHWTPEAVAAVADKLTEFINARVQLRPRVLTDFKTASLTVTNLGDIAVMLKLPSDQKVFTPQKVAVSQVLNSRNELWREDPNSDVLFLGDSFSNIYSLGAMGWGEAGGLVEQLSLRMQRPLDAILRNDAGAFATRQQLAVELARGRDRLAEKKLVIWQFAGRELSFGDWKLIDLKLGQPAPSSFLTLQKGETRELAGVVEVASSVPKPGAVPYKDHIVSLLVRAETEQNGRPLDLRAIVYLQSMKDNVWTDAARLRIGQEVRLRLRPWAEVSTQYERINRNELDDAALALEQPLWGELLK